MNSRLCLRQLAFKASSIRRISSQAIKHETDLCGIPLKPTWSVNELLLSYPTPPISPAVLNRLYQLSALIPPEEGTEDHAKITRDLQEMVRLVEAVKLVDTQGVQIAGRVTLEDADYYNESTDDYSDRITGERLLEEASRTSDGFYVVDTERKP